MKILFVHQNMPAQFRHLAPALAAAGHEVRYLTQRGDVRLPGVTRVTYRKPEPGEGSPHPYLASQDMAVRTGQQVARALVGMAKEGFTPGLIIGHPGWGELLYVKDVLPQVPLISYAEFFYRGEGLDVGFDPEQPVTLDTRCSVRTRNAHLLLGLEACDAALSPTHWQKSVHPRAFHDKIAVVFDGIDTAQVSPEGAAHLTLPDGQALTHGDEVLTYVARHLEPYRGFRTLMRALPEILRRRPAARVVIVGGDEVSYGHRPEGFANWREAMLAEVEIDHRRVHFTGRLAYAEYLRLLRVSRAHVYLSYPFVLGWSCLEAMACGALVIGSATPPVMEVIEHDRNGLLTDFFDPAALADVAVTALAEPGRFEPHRHAARQTVVDRYALDRCLPAQFAFIGSVLNKTTAIFAAGRS